MPATIRCTAVAIALWICCAAPSWAGSREEQIAANSITTINEIVAIPNASIPQGLLNSAAGVAIIPNMIRGGFIVSARHGRGVVMLRNADGTWGLPIFLRMTGGSIGFQAGLQATDVVLIFRTQRSVQAFMTGREFTLGADLSIAAGPVGRQAEAGTNAQLNAEIFSYSRSRGLFAGVSLGGSVIRVDPEANSSFYLARNVTPQQIQAGENLNVPEVATNLVTTMAQHAPGQATTVPAPQAIPQAIPQATPQVIPQAQP